MTTNQWKPQPADLVNLSFAPEYNLNLGKAMVQELELEIAKAQYRENFPEKEQATLKEAATAHKNADDFDQVLY